MNEGKRLFTDVIVPLVLYSLLLLVVQLVVSLVFCIVFFSRSGGMDIEQVLYAMTDFLLAENTPIALISYAVCGAVMLVDAKVRRASFFGYVGLQKKAGVPTIAYGVLMGVSLYFWVTAMLAMLPIPQELMEQYGDVSSVLEETTLLSVLCVGVAAPLTEEMIFRGVIYKYLRLALPEYVAVLLQGVIFGISHGTSPVWVAYAMFCGLLFGYIRMLTGGIRTTIAAHMAFNLCSFIPMEDENLLTALVCAAPVLLVFSAVRIYKRTGAQA